jgi:hypothetical protein
VTLPTFVGIGVARGGTTWLHTMLSSHPDVSMPERRKEIRFFDRNHDRGADWYASFFCSDADASGFAAIGEISPQYYYCEACPERIATLLPEARLLLMLRHPVDRAYSHYGFVVQRRNFRGTFERFLAERPSMLDKGFYGRYLDRYLRYFDRARVLALVFERAVRDERSTQEALASFLGVSPAGFLPATGKVNASTVPRFGSLSNVAVTTGRRLRGTRLESIVDLGARMGVRRAITAGRAMPRLDPGLRAQLSERYAQEFGDLESRYGIDVSCWR